MLCLTNLLIANNLYMRKITCELCAYSVEACRVAKRLGVDRVELCASPAEGGVTPSLATIERVAQIEGLALSVMIRPRGGDFLYDDDEFETMLLDIARAREAGATGVVFGVLTAAPFTVSAAETSQSEGVVEGGTGAISEEKADAA